jgi:hypothetical protein
MPRLHNIRLTLITVVIGPELTAVIIGFIIAGATYIGILEYRFRRVENHPLLRILRQIQDEQLLDIARRLLQGDHS